MKKRLGEFLADHPSVFLPIPPLVMGLDLWGAFAIPWGVGGWLGWVAFAAYLCFTILVLWIGLPISLFILGAAIAPRRFEIVLERMNAEEIPIEKLKGPIFPDGDDMILGPLDELDGRQIGANHRALQRAIEAQSPSEWASHLMANPYDDSKPGLEPGAAAEFIDRLASCVEGSPKSFKHPDALLAELRQAGRILRDEEIRPFKIRLTFG